MFDPSKLQLEGDPVAVQRDISTFFADARFRAADNGTLIFRKGTDQESHPEWFDRTGKSTPALEKADTYIGHAPISPDSTGAVFSRLDAQSNEDLWMADLKRSTLTPFASGRFRLEGPVWTPDGSRVIFQYELDGISDLYAKDVSGGEIKPLLKSKDYEIPSSVSRDGRFLLFHTRSPVR
jgi:Tol biopolymer transport system component